jgi:hypothetical protein
MLVRYQSQEIILIAYFLSFSGMNIPPSAISPPMPQPYAPSMPPHGKNIVSLDYFDMKVQYFLVIFKVFRIGSHALLHRTNL